MGDQFYTPFDSIDLAFFGKLTFKIRFLLTGELLGDTLKPFVDCDIIGVQLRDALFVE